ncbi:MAG: hypothetical protein IJS37_00520, partial [Bacilli bacterium]|nr:hypothetical protein [Bacilli bacterium]
YLRCFICFPFLSVPRLKGIKRIAKANSREKRDRPRPAVAIYLRTIIYTELYLSETKGTPALRPLVYNYPSQERVLNENTEIMLGENLLLIPSLFPGEMRRAGYFPEDFRHVES